MERLSENDIEEIIISLAENHPEYSMPQFRVDFVEMTEREPTLKEKQFFQKAVRNSISKKNTKLSSSPSSALLQVVNGYTFGDVLGEGAFGKVYKCQKEGKLYAVKKIDESKMTAVIEQGFADSISARLNSQFLVRYFDKFRGPAGELYVVMELCAKGDLRARINKLRELGGAFTEESLMKIAIQLLLGLDVMHSNRILHRDMKPENIFVDEHDGVKIGDFGCAKELDTTSEKAHTILGTPLYESPEVIKGEEYDSSADMWALGVILYELCTLERPFVDPNRFKLQQLIFAGIYSPIPKERCPPEMVSIIQALLNLDPLKRPSARTILQHPFVHGYAEHLESTGGKRLSAVLPAVATSPLAFALSPMPSPAVNSSSTVLPKTKAVSKPPPTPPAPRMVLAYPNAEDHYEGEMQAVGGVPVPHGKGKCVYNSGKNKGSVYIGDWVDGKREGQGTFTEADGSKYVGDFVKDLKEGKGVYVWGSIRIRKGEKETIAWSKGDLYEGDFANDLPEGEGVVRFVSGNVYNGQFKKGKMWGKGTFKTAKAIFLGVFADLDVSKMDGPVTSEEAWRDWNPDLVK